MRIESLHDALAYFPDIDGFWRCDSLAETEARIRSRLPQPGETEDTAKTVETLTQLARAQALQGALPEARTTLDQARQMISDSPTPLDSRTELRWLLEQGRVHCLAMNLTKAHEHFAQAWTLANETDRTFFAIDAALMLSTIRPPKFQNEWLQKALTLAETSKDETARMWLAHLLLLDGWHSYDFRQFEKALESFDRALAEPLAPGDEVKGFILQWSKARVLRATGGVAEALAIQESLLRRMQPLGKVSGHVYLEIAECKQLMKAQDEAKANFELAYAELAADGWYSDNKAEELSRMKYLYKKR